MKSHITVLISLFLLAGAAGGAGAAETVLASSWAQDCSGHAKQASLGKKTPRDAIDICSRALLDGNLSPKDSAAVYVDRAVLYLVAGNLEATQNDLDAAMAIMPELGEAYVNLGCLRIAQHRDREAVEALDRSLELGVKESQMAYYDRGVARENLDNLQGAYEDYKMAASLAPDWELPKAELARFKVRSAPPR